MRNLMLLLVFIGCITLASAQENQIRIQGKNMIELRESLSESVTPFPKLVSTQPIFPGYFSVKKDLPVAPQMVLATAPIPPAWQYENLAFFCKLEVKMEKALKMPIKVRLGEVQAVERKEGKLKGY